MGPQIITAIQGLSNYQKYLLSQALYKDPANRDVLAIIQTGRKTVEGTGSFVTNGTAAAQINNIRNRITIADAKLLPGLFFKTTANRSAAFALRVSIPVPNPAAS